MRKPSFQEKIALKILPSRRNSPSPRGTELVIAACFELCIVVLSKAPDGSPKQVQMVSSKKKFTARLTSFCVSSGVEIFQSISKNRRKGVAK